MPELTATHFVCIMISIFFGIGLHEFAHAKLADAAGDPTPRMYGRVTLNLFKHFDPLGTIMIIITAIAGVGIGWGRPVPMDPRRMKNPKWDHFAAVLGGPMTNLALAAFAAILFRLLLPTASQNGFLFLLLLTMVQVNVGLFLFNLLPIGPLDGMWIFGTFLDDRSRVAWTRWNLTTGQFVFLFIILIGQFSGFSLIGKIIGPLFERIARFLLGI